MKICATLLHTLYALVINAFIIAWFQDSAVICSNSGS